MPGGGGRHAHVIGRTSRKARENPFVGIENQNYDEICKKCRDEDILFEDPEFPADNSSLFFDENAPTRGNIEWKRPKEICDDPKFLIEGASRFDVKQGELGDCWLLAAVASLTIDQKLLFRVVPQDQNFEESYTGCFRFRFWHQGEWIEVVVDDRIPTYYDQLIYMHSTEKNEFWSALLEKAYAKLCGSYESLKGGSSSEAMEDFTGGVTESIDLTSPPEKLFNIMLKAFQRSSLMGCSLDADPNELEAKLPNGLICGHAYSITACKYVDIQTPRVKGKIPMVRIRNPWGESEWNGPWSDQSEEWRFIPDEEKLEIGLVNEEDGEFWMSFQDFCKNFKKLEICNLAPDSLDEEELNARSKKRWESTCENGSWIPGVSAGGCRNYLDTFWTNPQFRVTLTDADDDDDDNMCTLIVAVLQKDRRKKRKEGIELLTIGYMIYRLKEGDETGVKDVNFFKYNPSAGKSPSFINMREICGRHKLEPGSYLIVPSTFEPRHKGDFLMRVFSEKANQTGVMDEQTGLDDNQVDSGPTDEEWEQGEQLRNNFKEIAGDDMEIDAFELKDILNTVFTKEFDFEGFGIEPCRSMVALHDGDMSGKLGFEEFKSLWRDLRIWKANFKNFDSDNSGCLNSYELRSALRNAGFKLSNSSLHTLVARYSNKEGQIAFADFIMCAIRLKSILASFRNSDPDQTGIAAFHLEDFIQIAMYS
ncbi:CAPNN [Acanthosepion pharaonis]|uniref:CAPNN n=1 Tax=Acanthosepion pharaonis TaxID=158019 RepID=A0A812CHB8_ACAPH|nr:CAPNN [Sepia pharaonis]